MREKIAILLNYLFLRKKIPVVYDTDCLHIADQILALDSGFEAVHTVYQTNNHTVSTIPTDRIEPLSLSALIEKFGMMVSALEFIEQNSDDFKITINDSLTYQGGRIRMVGR